MGDAIPVGVIGVGSMGRNHARVYRELPDAEIVGVADADARQAREVAGEYGTDAMDAESLLERVDAVSIAVPTRHHFETASRALRRGVHVLVEKPFVEDPALGRQLVEMASDRDLTLQVGHIERFNPAIRTLADIIPDLEVIAVDAMRLGPPIDREIDVNPVLDLMIHDIDVVQSFLGDPTSVTATRSNHDPYVTATAEFETGVVGTFTASRTTQRKVRRLDVTAREAAVTVDYIDQSVEIHRHSVPEYVERDGGVRFRHQNIVERPTVENGEPLKAELASFVERCVTGEPPVVTGEDGLTALRIANRITDAAGPPEGARPREATL